MFKELAVETKDRVVNELLIDIKDRVLECFDKNVGEVQTCVEKAFSEVPSKGRKIVKEQAQKVKRMPSDWNIAVKHCFNSTPKMDMKECSVWWKSLDQPQKEDVLQQYR